MRAAAALARQPLLGLASLLLVAAIAISLAIAFGPDDAVDVAGPLAGFCALPAAVIAFLWHGWPANRLPRREEGLLDTLLAVAAGLVLAVVAQAAVGRVDLQGLVSARSGADPDTLTVAPFTLPILVGTFAALLQLALVWEGRPFRHLGEHRGGVVLLISALAISVAAYHLLGDWQLPAAELRARGVVDPDGPVPFPELEAWLVLLIAWQVIGYVVLAGRPVERIASRWRRYLVASAALAGLTQLSWLGLREAAGLSEEQTLAVGGSVLAAALVTQLIFDGWPFHGRRGPLSDLGSLAAMAAVGAVTFAGLDALGSSLSWDRERVELWVAAVCLSFVPVLGFLHVLVWLRWPLPAPASEREPGQEQERGRPSGEPSRRRPSP